MDAKMLFQRIDPVRWREAKGNPVLFLSIVPQKNLEMLSKDEGFIAHLQKVRQAYETQVLTFPDSSKGAFKERETVAYFSMEFGIHESLPLFAGGLGVLAGDHLKAASDLAIPITGIGLLYRAGFFHQFLNHDGWQQEQYIETDIYHLPIKRAKDSDGNEVRVSVEGPDGTIHAAVWKINVGRIPLYLLDTNLQENPTVIRDLTYRLYVADERVRLAQEILLGIGGMRALEAMGINPVVTHLNEGHCSFANIERLAQIKREFNLETKIAKEIVSRTTTFTTHTPVAAGHDEFPVALVRPYLKPYEKILDVPVEKILSWGQFEGADAQSPVSMFVLGLGMSRYCNGVSKLHGQTARRMWKHVWPKRARHEIPISHVTNGIHTPSWISVENEVLFDKYIGPGWQQACYKKRELIKRISDIYDDELWHAHELSRTRLIRACRTRLENQYGRRSAHTALMDEVRSVLDHDVLTIGFARRFATYKRSYLILKDRERFKKMLTSEKYPVQIIFAGKAHPKDNEGKELIKSVFEFAQEKGVRSKVVFLEDYDIGVARYMVQGADVWLNTPRRPFEACGTSGIKAAANGVLNLSISDGWWCEGYTEDTGWRIGNEEEYDDPEYQDMVESQSLYNLLENEVIPCFYDRESGGTPRRWLKMMKASMIMAMERFCAHGMVETYNKRYYLPAEKRMKELVADEAFEAKSLTALHERLSSHWKDIRVEPPVRDSEGPFRVGKTFHVTVNVFLGELGPDEVDVELYSGTIKSFDMLASIETSLMQVEEKMEGGYFQYGCIVHCDKAGRYGFTARVTPRADAPIKFAPGLITWV